MKKVELLAPAGSFESFLGAIHAGADAVYLGGAKYGARAFAKNFDEESLCRAIYYAHLFDRKVYLTLNTLMKQSELEEVTEFLKPYYLAGLDGVIVQDLGLLSFLKKNFPVLDLHVSTQAAVTGPIGARLLKEEGAVRIVPARELSLEEIKQLKQEDIEIETFIHGAMCYCYSGQCFFSSFLGGRSGNRGKCAQSCRLPYQVQLNGEKQRGKEEEYPLSLKDMCSIELLPELLRAGIDSFKIEGRMKRPEYVAGVTAIYRKYIDLCYENGFQPIKVEKKDWEALQSLYIRTDIQDGYYHRHNGREMVTLHKPGYNGTDDTFAAALYDRYVKTPLKAGVTGYVLLKKGEKVYMQLQFKALTISCEGTVVEQSQKRPVTKEDVEKQLRKTGSTDFEFVQLDVEMEEDIFIPLKALNELRREVFELLEKAIKAEEVEKRCKDWNINPEYNVKKEGEIKERIENVVKLKNIEISENYNIENAESIINDNNIKNSNSRKKELSVSVTTYEQCLAALELPEVQRIYISGDILLEQEKYGNRKIFKLLTEKAFSCKEENPAAGKCTERKALWLKLPEVLRAKDYEKIDRILILAKEFADGMQVSNLETYAYLKYHGYEGQIALNHHVYIWNQETKEFWKDKADTYMAPVECNFHEWKELQNDRMEYLCYGRIPMMVTANCIRKTKGQCRGSGVSLEDALADRYLAEFPVQTNCNYCYNVIYNSVPLSLHKNMEQLRELEGQSLRLDFTTETTEELKRIVTAFGKAVRGEEADFAFLTEYTTGHYKKGAL